MNFFLFREGAAFIADPAITTEHLPAVIEMFGAFLEFDSNVRFTSFNHRVYEVLPTMIVKIANGSRKHSGHRLARRCVRATMDSKMTDLVYTDASIVLFEDGSVAIQLHNKVVYLRQ